LKTVITRQKLVYVAHGERMSDISPEDRRLYASVDSAFIGQNVYLYCASVGLGTVFRGGSGHRGTAACLETTGGAVRDVRTVDRIPKDLTTTV
jgi:hypothetical protein